MEDDGYVTSGGEKIIQEEADLIVRAVSSGDFHATIPGLFTSLLFMFLHAHLVMQ